MFSKEKFESSKKFGKKQTTLQDKFSILIKKSFFIRQLKTVLFGVFRSLSGVNGLVVALKIRINNPSERW